MKYDLVVCSNTLLELSSTSERLETLSKLWDRLEKVRLISISSKHFNAFVQGGYLVLTETGTNAGFHVIAEARDYLIQVTTTTSNPMTCLFLSFFRCHKYLRMRRAEATASPLAPTSPPVLDTHSTQSPATFLSGQNPDNVIT